MDTIYPYKHSNNSIIYHKLLGLNGTNELHRHNFFMILLVEKGKGNHTIDSIVHSLKDKQIHLIFPGHIHALKLDEEAIIHVLMISIDLFKSFARRSKFSFIFFKKHPVINLTEEGMNKLQSEFLDISMELLQNPPLVEILNAHLFIIEEILSREVVETLGEDNSPKGTLLLFQYLKLVDLFFEEQKSVSFYALKLNITPNYLNMLCRKYFYCTAIGVIQYKLIQETKKLLITGEFSIKEIGFRLGFKDISYFSRFFKSIVGISPKEFKSQN